MKNSKLPIVKPIIDGIVIVEGKTDTQKLQSLYDVETIETNGSALDTTTLALIKEVAQHHKIYLFLDPDGPGEKIRQTLHQALPQSIHVFLKKEDMQKHSKKIGIAEATNEAIIEAFKNAITFDKSSHTLSLQEFDSLQLNTKAKRQYLCNQLKISCCNQKTLFKRLNMMHLDVTQVATILGGYHG